MDAFELIGYTFVVFCAGLMLRFIASSWNRMNAAITGYQFFTAILGLIAGVLFFPITILFQLFDVSFGE